MPYTIINYRSSGRTSPPFDDVTRQLMDILKSANKPNSSDSEDNTSVPGMFIGQHLCARYVRRTTPLCQVHMFVGQHLCARYVRRTTPLCRVSQFRFKKSFTSKRNLAKQKQFRFVSLQFRETTKKSFAF